MINGLLPGSAARAAISRQPEPGHAEPDRRRDLAEVGYYMIIFLAGLQSIPYDLYEAAKLDGAKTWRLFWSITLPLLRPTLLFVIVINTPLVAPGLRPALRADEGRPVNSTNTLVHLYVRHRVQVPADGPGDRDGGHALRCHLRHDDDSAPAAEG